MKMNWKFKLMIAFGVSLAAVILLKLPASLAQTDADSAVKETRSSAARGKITRYANGVVKAEPQGFAITGAVRDMPTSDPDALVKRANFIDPEKAREMRAEEQRNEKGIAVAEEDEKE